MFADYICFLQNWYIELFQKDLLEEHELLWGVKFHEICLSFQDEGKRVVLVL